MVRVLGLGFGFQIWGFRFGLRFRVLGLRINPSM